MVVADDNLAAKATRLPTVAVAWYLDKIREIRLHHQHTDSDGEAVGSSLTIANDELYELLHTKGWGCVFCDAPRTEDGMYVVYYDDHAYQKTGVPRNPTAQKILSKLPVRFSTGLSF